jgi:hypothetical protein
VRADRSCPTAPGATVGRWERGRRLGGAKQRTQLAIETFNASRATRMVAGLNRTLGEPQVSVGAAAGSSSEMRVTIAWELSWYQWAVDVEGEGTVRALAKGSEVTELDGSSRMWNGGASADGSLYVGRPGRPARRRRRLSVPGLRGSRSR